MSRVIRQSLVMLALLPGVAMSAPAQTTGSISGIIQDKKQAAIPNATDTARNVQPNFMRAEVTSHFSAGRCYNW